MTTDADEVEEKISARADALEADWSIFDDE